MDEKKVAAVMVELVRLLEPQQRVSAMDAVRDEFCEGCGYEQPKTGRRCQCQNDE